MYVRPSTSVIVAPDACEMKRGVPPTPLNARTGEFTPPGINSDARANNSSDERPCPSRVAVILSSAFFDEFGAAQVFEGRDSPLNVRPPSLLGHPARPLPRGDEKVSQRGPTVVGHA